MFKGREVVLERRNILTGDRVTNAIQEYDPDTGTPQVSINLDGVGGDRMHDATKDNVGNDMAILFKELRPRTRIVGVSAASAPCMARAFATGRLEPVRVEPTLADGLAVGTPVPETLAVMRRFVDDVIEVTEEQIALAIVIYARTIHQLAEGVVLCAHVLVIQMVGGNVVV